MDVLLPLPLPDREYDISPERAHPVSGADVDVTAYDGLPKRLEQAAFAAGAGT